MLHHGGRLLESSEHDGRCVWWWISLMSLVFGMHKVEWEADERRPAPGSPWNHPSFYFVSKQVLALVILADGKSYPFSGLQHIGVQDGSVPDNRNKILWNLCDKVQKANWPLPCKVWQKHHTLSWICLTESPDLWFMILKNKRTEVFLVLLISCHCSCYIQSSQSKTR